MSMRSTCCSSVTVTCTRRGASRASGPGRASPTVGFEAWRLGFDEHLMAHGRNTGLAFGMSWGAKALTHVGLSAAYPLDLLDSSVAVELLWHGIVVAAQHKVEVVQSGCPLHWRHELLIDKQQVGR